MIKEALRVQDREAAYMRPVSATLGRLSSPTTALLMGSMAPMGATAGLDNPEIAAAVEKLKQDPALDDVTLSLGSVRPLDAIADVWSNKNTGLASKLLGTLASPIQSVVTSINRSDHYDPYSNRVTLFNADPAVLYHEMGHAKDFGESDEPISYALARNVVPGAALYQEGQASLKGLHDMMEGTSIADPSAVDTAELQADVDSIVRANRVLGGGIGSYAGFGLGSLIASETSAGSILAKKLAPLLQLPDTHLKGPARAALGLLGGLGGALLGQAIGHTARPFTQGDDREALAAAEELLKSAAINDALMHDAQIRATEKVAARLRVVKDISDNFQKQLRNYNIFDANPKDFPKLKKSLRKTHAITTSGKLRNQIALDKQLQADAQQRAIQESVSNRNALKYMALPAAGIAALAGGDMAQPQRQPSVSNPWQSTAPVGRPTFRPNFNEPANTIRSHTRKL